MRLKFLKMMQIHANHDPQHRLEMQKYAAQITNCKIWRMYLGTFVLRIFQFKKKRTAYEALEKVPTV